MPNHVTTILRAPAHVLDSLKSEDREVDFNTMIPFPDELKNITAEVKVFLTQAEVDTAQAEANARRSKYTPEQRKFLGIDDTEIDAISFERQGELLEKYGAIHWYDWNITNWGTKWNAYDIERREPEVLKFETAWSLAYPAVEALSEKFPDTEIHVQYADENAGYNYGDFVLLSGLPISGGHEHLGRGTEEALRFAVPITWGMTYDEYLAELEN